MTKEQTINYAIDNLMDNGQLIEVINGHTHSTYTDRTRQELSDLYDEMSERGMVTAEKLAAKYAEFDKERREKNRKRGSNKSSKKKNRK